MRTIQELKYLERLGLKVSMLVERADAENDSPSWGELADADELISDSELDEYYQGGVMFGDDDII